MAYAKLPVFPIMTLIHLNFKEFMKKTWFLIFILLFMQSVYAVKINTLYQSEVSVNTQSAQERSKAIQLALAQVLIKVSGDNQILVNPYIKSHLNSAETLAQEFSYRTAETTPGVTTTYLLQVHFDVKGVNQWLRDANAPLWGQNRPTIISWIEFESPNKPPEIISHDSTNDLVNLIKQYADKRGIPVIIPIMDVSDLNQITIDDVKNMSIPKISLAGKRYGSNIILIGHVIQNAQGFTTQWKLSMGNDQWEWDLPGSALADIIPVLVNKVADTVSARYAVVTTNTIQKDVSLKIIGITQQNDFTQLVRYLNHLTPVADVSILRITGNEIFLSVSLRSTQQSFIQTLALGQRLTAVSNDINASPLIYQWNH